MESKIQSQRYELESTISDDANRNMRKSAGQFDHATMVDLISGIGYFPLEKLVARVAMVGWKY